MQQVDSSDATAPLSGIRILDLSRHMSAPYATAVLSDYGADVIKVEALPIGDPSRRIGTAFVGDESALYLMWNRGKRSIALDLRQERGREVVRSLARSCDLFVENYRPGVAEAMGLGYEDIRSINDRIIYCALSAFGPEGPLVDYPGTDPVVQALSGVMSVTGTSDGEPLLVGIPIADFTGAMSLVQAVTLGLLARDKTGRGQRIDISMLAGLLAGLTTRLATYWATGDEPERTGSAHSVVAPYQAFATADGWMVAGAWAAEGWPRFCAAIERTDLVDDPRFDTNTRRVAHRDELNAILGPIFRSHPTAEWDRRFRESDGLFGEICTIPQIITHPQVAHLTQYVEHATQGRIPQLGPYLRFSDTPGAIRHAPPVLGQHTADILREAGLADDDLRQLLESGVALQADVEGAHVPTA